MTIDQPISSIRSRNSLLAATLSVVAALLLLAISRVEPTMLGLYITVAVMAVACFLPAWIGFIRGNLDYFEFIHPFGLIYFLNFGAGSIWVMHDPGIAYDIHLLPYIPKAAFYALLGYLAFLAGYYGPLSGKLGGDRKRQHWIPKGPQFFVALGGIGLLGFLVWAEVFRSRYVGASALSGLTSLLGQLSFLFILAWGLINLIILSGKATRSQKYAYFAFMIPATMLIAQAYVSRKQTTITLVLVPLVAFWYARRKVPWAFLIALFLILVFVLFPLYNAVRFQDWSLSVGERLSETFDTMQNWDGDEYMDRSVGSLQSRLALVNSLAVVLRDVGRWVPYQKGESYLMAPAIILIPRIVWPDKPELSIGLEFGYRFRVVHATDTLTSIAPSLPGELYWEADLPGILIGMALIGLGTRWFYRRFAYGTPTMSLDRGIYILLLMRTMVIEGALLAEFAGMIKVLLLLALLKWGCRKMGWLQPARAAASPEPAA